MKIVNFTIQSFLNRHRIEANFNDVSNSKLEIDLNEELKQKIIDLIQPHFELKIKQLSTEIDFKNV